MFATGQTLELKYYFDRFAREALIYGGLLSVAVIIYLVIREFGMLLPRPPGQPRNSGLLLVPQAGMTPT